MRRILVMLLLAWAWPASAQLHDHASGLAHGIPDLCALDATAHMVPAGATEHFAGPMLPFSCIGVHGKAFIDGSLSATTVLTYDDGELTVANGVTVTWRDTSLNLILDPEQYGHGLIGLGKIRINGAFVTPFVRLTADVHAGVTILKLPVPGNWAVGQRLEVPDTRQIAAGDLRNNGFPETNVPVRLVDQNEVCLIAAVSTTTVTCTAPLVYAHLGAHAPAVAGYPALDYFPHVANLTRGITFHSENPNGVRAHSLFSQRADVQIRGAAFIDMGRTTGAKLDDTTFAAGGTVAHLGTNQRARYPIHFHHVFGPVTTPDPYQFVIVDSVIERPNKWGLSVHNSSWGLVQDNVLVGPGGAGIVLEDGDEVNNLIDHNFGTGFENLAFNNVPMSTYDPEGNKGAFIWTTGIGNDLTRNVGYASKSCIELYTGNAESGAGVTERPQRIPNVRGADTTVDANVSIVINILVPMGVIDGNECASMTLFGIAPWWTQASLDGLRTDIVYHHRPITHSTFWHQGTADGGALSLHYADAVFDGVTALNEGGLGTFLVEVNDAGAACCGPGWSTIAHADVRGFGYAWLHGGQLGPPPRWRVTDSFFQTRNGFRFTNSGQDINIEPDPGQLTPLRTARFQFTNFSCAPLAGSPLACLETVYGTREVDEPYRRLLIDVRGFQGDPADQFRVYFKEQAASALAPIRSATPSRGDSWPDGCPVAGQTNQQAWAQFRCATLMEAAPADATMRPGIRGLSGPLPADDVVPPQLPGPIVSPPPPPASFSCLTCVTAVMFNGEPWSLGAPADRGADLPVLRNGVHDGASFAVAYLLLNGKLYVYNVGASGWFEWDAATSTFATAPDPRSATPDMPPVLSPPTTDPPPPSTCVIYPLTPKISLTVCP